MNSLNPILPSRIRFRKPSIILSPGPASGSESASFSLPAVAQPRRVARFQKADVSETRESDQERDEFGVVEESEGEEFMSPIPVPRQRYIPVSKKALLDGLVSLLDSAEEAEEFLLVSSCLDSIIHAEHKVILEEMRMDYFSTHPLEENSDNSDSVGRSNESMWDSHDMTKRGFLSHRVLQGQGKHDSREKSSYFTLDLKDLLNKYSETIQDLNADKSRVAVETRFQRSFLKLLQNAQFDELSAHDLQLTAALNNDYILTLPIYVDWKRASKSNAIIFRRGFAAERQKGLLIAQKLDFIQSKLLQKILQVLSKPLGEVGIWITEVWNEYGAKERMRALLERFNVSLNGSYMSKDEFSDEGTSSDESGVNLHENDDLPMWLAAQRSVLRYEGLLSPAGPRERLFRKMLSWTGLFSSPPRKLTNSSSKLNTKDPYMSSNFLSRITLNDIWRPAAMRSCDNNIWKMFKASIRILLSRSVLQEPAFKELILLYYNEMDWMQSEGQSKLPNLRMKVYGKIPIPDLSVIFPHKKLSFRILDTVRLDIASILGLSAYFVNYKFEDLLISPSAFLLDIIAATALVIFVSRVALGYKQTWDRYQLLVNKTLYEKTLASDFGSVYFLLDESEQQQYKEAILAYMHLLQMHQDEEGLCREKVADMCERFIYDNFNEKVEMPIDKAMETLLRLGLVTETRINGTSAMKVVPCSVAYVGLKQRWERLLAKGPHNLNLADT